ncbi:ketose-bisphosphate aldolase [Bacillota bacterium Meth-B3]|nr:ketose-bisphosphate aldolase [Christensenellaceae bacterium]MEA5064649.1 ketose-bisphosphate aldolase [Eubacteriales bacterium]MEA5068225.1 ketose-bisphosphate aldolase [Christensenellaceae bacterium]
MLVDIRTILEPAQKNGFAVPAFNVSSSMLLRGVIEGCEEKGSPVIVAIHPDELSFVMNSFTHSVLAEAHRTRLPVCLHLDHGASYDQAVNAIRCGFTSVMIDSSTASFEDNIRLTRKVVEAAHAAGVTVEAELGTIGATGNGGEAGTDDIIYTNPADVASFVGQTGIDALAVAIGTAHGLYPKGKKPALRLDLLGEIRKLVDIPLVLHGGSDNPDWEIREAVKLGISKINISSDIKAAFYRKCREVLADESLREPNAIYPPCIAAMKKVVHEKIDLFGSEGAARHY